MCATDKLRCIYKDKVATRTVTAFCSRRPQTANGVLDIRNVTKDETKAKVTTAPGM